MAFIILGSVLEGIPAIVLFGPLLFPVAKAMGVHEVHYALVSVYVGLHRNGDAEQERQLFLQTSKSEDER